jgi:hypothetical protein
LPLAPWPKLCVNHIICCTTLLPAIATLTVRAACRRLGIAAGSQAGSELLQVAGQLA